MTTYDNNTAVIDDTSFLQQTLFATKNTSEEKAKSLLQTFTEQALAGTIVWDKNLLKTLNNTIEKIDTAISQQLQRVVRHDAFRQLEGAWRGLHHLVHETETSSHLRIKVLNISKADLQTDFSRAVEFDQSQLFKKVYEAEYGTPGGMPYSVLVGDYTFSHQATDVALLQSLSEVAAASFSPFISSADPYLFGFDDWTDLNKPRDLSKIFDSADYIKWRSFRESDDARFVCLTLPRVMARLPYGEATNPVESFAFEELPTQPNHNTQDYCWMNAAYALTSKITQAIANNGWPTAMRGAENGGMVSNLPVHSFQSAQGDLQVQCPTETGITDRREAELSKLGFLPLSHYKDADYAVFFGAQSVQQVKRYDNPQATKNAQISARLPYILATSRFAHYLKVMARDKIGSFMEAKDAESWLNNWILQYVNANPDSNQSLKAKYPLAEAKVTIESVPGEAGAYHAVAWLRPWLQFEELTTSMRLVARIPERK